ncbi:MAG: ribonucleoside-triphosphate reductase, adenosylcobalamin-dependent [Gloeomargarita sp. SKYBB_i_bin120]|nr:ribonucleoside-triphosphate reductase, adenosylcobalamin-dependent [Gloeomargarita sp. SKYB120]MDW8178131.1 ribonucleoside-triphosphate reductase, adenosylcobalamin-dependent [Gloeomargarita sp. SKYBB_i_bin120]
MTQAPERSLSMTESALEAELDHRMSRYGLNPCVTADTWVQTEWGARQVKELIGQPHGTYVHGKLFQTTPAGFFCSGMQPVFRLHTWEGYCLRLTANHPVLKVIRQTTQRQDCAWVAAAHLQPGDLICLHNHRGMLPWSGIGTWTEGWLLGNLMGDGCLSEYVPSHGRRGHWRYWGEHQVMMAEFAQALCQSVFPDFSSQILRNHPQNRYSEVGSARLFHLAASYGLGEGRKIITPAIERASYEFYRGFLGGFFDADGSVQGDQTKGVSVRLAHSDLERLRAVQRMLLRLGIVSTLSINRRPAHTRLLPNSQRQLVAYPCRAQHELVISGDNLQEFQRLIGFRDPDKATRLATLLERHQRHLNRERFTATVMALVPDGEELVYDCSVPGANRFDANGLVVHNCGEIIGADFHCNLSEIHLNRIDPHNFEEQEKAFTAGALTVAALLHHRFVEPRFQYSREIDPIVGVSFTGLFDFFVHAFGKEWLQWWAAGRPDSELGLILRQKEADYLTFWKEVVHRVVWDYCDRHGLRRPNRCTTVQPAGTKSLLTNASPGWHPPKAQRYIRRITFAKNDPVALACMDYGYSVVPGQADKDEQGHLLNDPFDPRCTEWLVEIPVAVSWADIADEAGVDISQFSALAQFDFYMNVQRHYTTHNTSATIEFREHEIEQLADRIYQAIQHDEGYISAALLARFDALQTFPRLPFEPISKERYEALMQQVLQRRKSDDFGALLRQYDQPQVPLTPEVAACEGMTCETPSQPPAT